ncbi:MAG: tetratricopeptide repeat-containing protein [Phenylobacterium sp.]
MPSHAQLSRILATARAGAPGEAWRLFREAGLEGERADPAVLAVRGRLLKEEARGAEGAARAVLQGEAAEAYAAAGALSGATYHLINAATLWRLAGDTDAAQAVAARVLDSLERNPDEAETPYWRGATRAEALLLLGRRAEAAAALALAVKAGPQAWEDHAATLRQFRLICAAERCATAWLEVLTPPRAAHFAGHMAPADEADLRARADELLAQMPVGFAFGALAAGADIVIAEALADAGAELNLVLPADPATFRAISVDVHPGGWGERFDRLLDRAGSLQAIGDGPPAPDELSVALAAQIAMGEAARRAAELETEAIQIVALDPASQRRATPGGAAWARDRWATARRRQFVLPAGRGRGVGAMAHAPTDVRLAAVLAIAIDPADVRAFADAVASGPAPLTPPVWTGAGFSAVYAEGADAVRAAWIVIAAMGPRARIGGGYGRIRWQAPPQVGPVATGAPADAAAAILASVPAGAAHVSGRLGAVASVGVPALRLTEVDERSAEDGVSAIFALALPG